MGLLVIEPGLSTTVQDAGRPGYREWGVPLGGAFDRFSAGLANALLGNSPECAVLESTLSGGNYQAEGELALALAGAPMQAKVISHDGAERIIRPPLSFTLRDGERLVLGRTSEWVRTYLAVKAGWQTGLVLGSRSSETRIRKGEILPCESAITATRRPEQSGWPSTVAGPLRVVDGPDCRMTPELDASFWTSHRFRVGSSSDRVGLRLSGEPVRVASAPERLSSPVAPGAVQVAGGQLIVLGVACGTMGGYPHVAHVISADLDRLGQLKPGDLVQFCRLTIEDARCLDQESRQARKTLFSRVVALAADAGE